VRDCSGGRIGESVHRGPVAEKVGVVETAREFLERRAGNNKARDVARE